MSQQDNEKVYELNKECSIKDHRSCLLATAVGMAADISCDEGLALSPQLKHILDTQRLTESTVRSALQEWINTVPDSQKEIAAELLNTVCI